MVRSWVGLGLGLICRCVSALSCPVIGPSCDWSVLCVLCSLHQTVRLQQDDDLELILSEESSLRYSDLRDDDHSDSSPGPGQQPTEDPVLVQTTEEPPQPLTYLTPLLSEPLRLRL